MPSRIPWNQHEVALLIDTFLRVAEGADLGQAAERLSLTLRELAIQAGLTIDDTYRNVNGMKMQLANVQYLFTDGQKGLSGASAMIRQMYELYKADPAEYQTILKEAIRLTSSNASIEDAFFAYAKERIGLSPRMLSEYLQKAADYCHLKQPLLGMKDVKAVRNVQQKVAEGKLLPFRYGKNAQTIRNVTQLYYTFIKSYRETKEEPPVQTEAAANEKKIPTQPAPVVDESIIELPIDPQPAAIIEVTDESSDESGVVVLREDATEELPDDRLYVDFNRDNSYLFTKPVSYTYRGVVHPAFHWIRVYRGICQLLFDDYRDTFMTVINGDIPGENTLAFADEQNVKRLRSPKSFASGYYLEANLDATTIVRKLCGLYHLCNLGDALKIRYRRVEGYDFSDTSRTNQPCADSVAPDTGYDWNQSRVFLVDFEHEHSYAFTQPEAYEYKGATRRVNKWGKLYADLCGAMFEDHRDIFMSIMNGDVPGYSALAFADEQHKNNMRVARCFAPGFYLESNMDATSIVRRIRGLYRLFELGSNLRISYTRQDNTKVDPTSKETGEEWLIHELRNRKIPYVDNRASDGCLWIASDMSISISLNEAADKGYRLRFKQDGCRAFPNRPVLWTKDQPEQPKPAVLPGRDNYLSGSDDFNTFLVQNQRLAVRTAGNYCTSIRMIEEYIRRNALPYSLANATSSVVQSVVDALMSRPDFVKMNDERHHQYSAAMAQYVSYLVNKNQITESAGEQRQPASSRTVKETVVPMEDNAAMLADIRERILSFISESFPHGIRPASIIDINKLKRAYQTKFVEGLPAEVDLASLLMSMGLNNGEKVYFLSEDQKQSMCSLITGIIESGHRVIYYSELLTLHSELFEACHIYESPLMRTVFTSVMPEYIYKADWMLANRDANEIEEVTRAFGEDIVLTYQQVKSRCPYLTLDVIKWALSRSDRFVWSSPETYAQADLIELDQAEVSDIVNRILPVIREKGYFSLAQLPIEESCGMNPQVSSSAVRDAIYNRYMSNEFTRYGLIVKLPGVHLNTYQLMVGWLKGLEQVTLTEVEDYERKLTGHHAVLGIAAASNTMIRVDHDHYVSDASIQFDVDAVDHAISLFAGNRIIPITAITSYTSFPDVPGYNWNLYLVESFLRRFSKRFTIDGGPAQMSYVGGISSADRHFANYEDRLAHAVIQDGVTLTEEAIGRYLTDRKYILRRSETVRKTLERARILNEQRGESSVRI